MEDQVTSFESFTLGLIFINLVISIELAIIIKLELQKHS